VLFLKTVVAIPFRIERVLRVTSFDEERRTNPALAYWLSRPPAVTWTVPKEPNAVKRLVRKLERDAPGPVRMCYEAGPCGYALQRQVATARVSCQVIAPGLIPRKPGDRIKTNRRDARKLAELFRAGLLTEVRPPTPEDEAVRSVPRTR
jgi:transposase